MGANYYAVYDTCDHCHRSERLHICKSLVSFEGHFIGDTDDTPWLVSWADWKDWLTSHADCVFDEYGKRYEVADFVRRVEATSREARSRQYQWCVAHPAGRLLDRVVPDGDWLDPDGFSFYGGPFS